MTRPNSRKPPVDRPATTRVSATTPSKDDDWQKNAAIIRKFLDSRPDYEQLCGEVAYTLAKLLKDAGIKVAAITSRAKTMESFLEKIQRKHYADPLSDLTDFAGTRVVCFYRDDLLKVEELIRTEFEVDQTEDKSGVLEVDRFGYSATHFLVRLGKTSSGARYDHLKGRLCEIQLRTVLQDAWAIFSHHLLYKHEADIPDELKREINAIAAVLECADVLYQGIRDKRAKYIASISATPEEWPDVKTNLDSLTKFLSDRFPEKVVEEVEGQLSWILECPQFQEYSTLQDVDNLLRRTEAARALYMPKFPLIVPDTAATHLMCALAMEHQELAQDFLPADRLKEFLAAAESVES